MVSIVANGFLLISFVLDASSTQCHTVANMCLVMKCPRCLGCRLLIAFFALAASTASAEDFNRTIVHYFLTSGQNLRLEIERTRSVVNALLADEWQEALERMPEPTSSENPVAEAGTSPRRAPTVSDRYVGYFRIDYLIPRKKDEFTFLFGTLGLATRNFRPIEDIWVGFLGGFTFFDVLERKDNKGFESTTIFYNFVGGFEAGYKKWVSVDVNVSVNGLHLSSQDKWIWDFDQAYFRGSVPFLGPYGVLQYDLGDARTREVEVGWTHSFRRHKLGLLTLAYNARFMYPVTGIAVRDDLDPSERFNVPGDHSGVLRWEAIGPLWHAVELHVVGAFGNVPQGVRHAWLGVTFFPFASSRLGIFARTGTAYSRLKGLAQKSRFFGGSGGIEVAWAHTTVPVHTTVRDYREPSRPRITETQIKVPVTITFRLLFGYRDPDIVDRLGDIGKATASGTMQITF